MLAQIVEFEASFLFESTFSRHCLTTNCSGPRIHHEEETIFRLQYQKSFSSLSLTEMPLHHSFRGSKFPKCDRYPLRWTLSKQSNLSLVHLPGFDDEITH